MLTSNRVNAHELCHRGAQASGCPASRPTPGMCDQQTKALAGKDCPFQRGRAECMIFPSAGATGLQLTDGSCYILSRSQLRLGRGGPSPSFPGTLKSFACMGTMCPRRPGEGSRSPGTAVRDGGDPYGRELRSSVRAACTLTTEPSPPVTFWLPRALHSKKLSPGEEKEQEFLDILRAKVTIHPKKD